ncbi:serine hydrolase domain-containing protein [Caulobacter sp. DWR1-3-2b1]|uniref:serine hydrolase domain-containing protein n=1 Tax=Caulobacter sp. DWR1-3-2b1 TaxID=2804670 RepID=UPI003CEC1801
MILAVATALSGGATAQPLAVGNEAKPLAALIRSGGPPLTGRVLVADRTKILSDERSGAYGDAPIWPWGSVSKQVAAVIVMSGVDRGELALDEPIARYWQAFPTPTIGGVTIRQLLRHTAGLANPEDTPQTDDIPAFYLRRAIDAERDDAVTFCAGPVKRPPETSFEYNNCDTIVLASVLGSTMGKGYEQLLADRVARPLGLQSLRLAKANERPIIANAKGQAVKPVNLATFGAAGALLGTPEDLVRFDQALLARSLVSSASTDVMWKGDPAIGYAALGAWSFSAPLAGCQGAVAMVERRGAVDGVQIRNIIAPDRGRILVVFSDDAEFDFGEIWQGRGPSYVLASEAFCR